MAKWYRITEVATGKVAHEYGADAPLSYGRADWDDPALFQHAEGPAPIPPVPLRYDGRRRLTKMEFIDLLTDEEYVAILSAAKASVQIEAWLKKFEMTTPDPDGTSVSLDDPRTVAGMQQMELLGLIGAGRAVEILRG